jgi:hypothetical protein
MAARSIGTLAAQIVANDEGFVKALDRVEKALTSTERKAKKTGGGIGEAFSFGAGIGVGIAAIESLGNRIASAVSKISTSIEALNRAAENASMLGLQTTEIQEIEGAFKLANVEAETTRRILDDMVRTVSDAKAGDDSAIAQLARLGLESESLRGLGTKRILEEVADGLAGIENPADRAAAAFDLFGKLGHNALRVLGEGADGLRASIEEVRSVGGVLSEVDVQKAVILDQAFDRLSIAIEGSAKRIAVELAPALILVANTVEDILKNINSDGASEFINAMVEGWRESQRVSHNLVGQIGAGYVLLTQGNAAANEFVTQMQAEAERVGGGRPVSQTVADVERMAADAAKKQNDNIRRIRRIERLRFQDEIDQIEEASKADEKAKKEREKRRLDEIAKQKKAQQKLISDLWRENVLEMQSLRLEEVNTSLSALTGLDLRARDPGLPELTLAGSAEAQRLAFNADSSPSPALKAQQQTARNTREIALNTLIAGTDVRYFLP